MAYQLPIKWQWISLDGRKHGREYDTCGHDLVY